MKNKAKITRSGRVSCSSKFLMSVKSEVPSKAKNLNLKQAVLLGN